MTTIDEQSDHGVFLTPMTLRPADLGSLPSLYIGRSQFTADPALDGRIDSFRLYDRALAPDEISKIYQYSGT